MRGIFCCNEVRDDEEVFEFDASNARSPFVSLSEMGAQQINSSMLRSPNMLDTSDPQLINQHLSGRESASPLNASSGLQSNRSSGQICVAEVTARIQALRAGGAIDGMEIIDESPRASSLGGSSTSGYIGSNTNAVNRSLSSSFATSRNMSLSQF